MLTVLELPGQRGSGRELGVQAQVAAPFLGLLCEGCEGRFQLLDLMAKGQPPAGVASIGHLTLNIKDLWECFYVASFLASLALIHWGFYLFELMASIKTNSS